MKIVFLTSCLGRGGAERVATILCNAWAGRGDQVTLIPTYSGGGSAGYALAPDVESIFLADAAGVRGKGAGSYTRRLLVLRALIARRRPDVVISFLPNVNAAAVVATAFLGVPLIICERSDPSMRSSRAFWEICCRMTYRFADMLAVQTDAVADKVRDIYPGLRAVRRLPNPVSATATAVVGQRAGARKVLLSLGRLVPEKQVVSVVDAFAGLAARFADWDLHVYGDGPLRAPLATRIAELGLQRRIVLMGQTADVARIMAQADAFVIASRYEGFPNALLEAMASGLPCVAVDCPSGPHEITRNGEDALLVPLDDSAALAAALARIMGDATLRDQLGVRGQQSVLRRFSLDAVMRLWDDAFAEIGVRGNSASRAGALASRG